MHTIQYKYKYKYKQSAVFVTRSPRRVRRRTKRLERRPKP